MRWLVGIDLRPASHGAFELAAWLERHARGHRLSGLHVIEQRALGPRFDPATTAALELSTRERLEQLLHDAHARSAFDDLGVTFGAAADQSLEAGLLVRHADGLIVGRHAPAGEDEFFRLGRVARRLLRKLPVPTFVAPPRLRASDVPDGPVLALSDLRSHSVAAVRLAATLASALGRALVVAHCVDWLERAVVYLPRRESRDEGGVIVQAQADLHAWIDDHALVADRVLALPGRVISTALRLAERERACMIVCGSRNLSAGERLFLTSAASELAAAAPVPMLVVPEDAQTAA